MNRSHAGLAEALSDRYTIRHEVGAGGMATVFLADDKKHERQVALKVLRPELAAAMGADRFPREIRMVAQFNHPHILSLYDSGETGGFLYYVMPYVDGESLRDRLTREKQIPIHDAVRILREVADALAYAHARNVVHRDIKPGNVLLSGRHAVVTDFGVAKALSASGGDKVTTVGIAVGTPQYMAPEQAMGESDIDARADIYALGILGYEMLTGRPPFDGGTSQAVLAAQVMETPVDIQQVRGDIPPILADAVMRCLKKKRDERWQTADEFIARLEMVGTTPSGGMTPTNTRPLPAATVPKKTNRAVYVAAAVAVVAIGAIGTWLATQGGGSGRIERIAVMPIDDISGKDSVFVDLMLDGLTNRLAQLGNVGVESRANMMRYKSGAKSTRDIAKELNLDAMITASVFRAGDVVRITVQLDNPVTTRSLWATTYDRDVKDVLAAQTEVVQKIAASVDSVLSAPPKK